MTDTSELVKKAADWATPNDALHEQIKPVAFELASVQINFGIDDHLVAIGQAIELGIYIGRYGMNGIDASTVPTAIIRAFGGENS